MKDTICSLATGGGTSAIAIIRISGQESIKIANTIFIDFWPEIRMIAIALVPPPVAKEQIVSFMLIYFIWQKYLKSFVYLYNVIILQA